MNSYGNVTEITKLSDNDRLKMFNLMKIYYENISWDNFNRDLNEKEWVVILRNNENDIVGFSTIMIIDHPDNEISVKGIFSGDTIVHKDYRGQYLLQITWFKFILFELPQLHPDHKLYWILTTKGYKTYRLMTDNFKNFFPRFDRHTPRFENNLINVFSLIKFSEKFNSDNGTLHYDGKKDKVRQGVAEITEKHLENPHIAFFVEKNPGYVNGDELICIAEASLDNVEPFMQDIILNDLKENSAASG